MKYLLTFDIILFIFIKLTNMESQNYYSQDGESDEEDYINTYSVNEPIEHLLEKKRKTKMSS